MPVNERLITLTRRAARDLDASRAALTVMRASSLLSREIERAAAAANLTLPQFNVLMELASSPNGTLPMHELTDRLIATPPSLSWLTSRMSDSGLITKERSTEDARVVLLTVTETGWEAVAQAMPRVFDVEKLLWQGYPKDDLRRLVELLRPLLQHRNDPLAGQQAAEFLGAKDTDHPVLVRGNDEPGSSGLSL